MCLLFITVLRVLIHAWVRAIITTTVENRKQLFLSLVSYAVIPFVILACSYTHPLATSVASN